MASLESKASLFNDAHGLQTVRGSFAGVDIRRRVRSCEYRCECVNWMDTGALVGREVAVAYDTNEKVRIVECKYEDLIGIYDCSRRKDRIVLVTPLHTLNQG